MKLTILARSKDEFGVVLNSEVQHKTQQSIFKVTVSDGDLHDLTEARVDKEHLIEFAFNFLIEREPASAIQSQFNISVISTFFPDFPEAVKQWVDENT
jgi:hypothetical protein